MSDKATRLREANEAYGELRQAIEGLTDDQMRRAWLGTWGVREIAIHITGWHEAMVPALASIASGEAPYPPGTYDDFDTWNAKFVAAKAGSVPADALARMDASHRALVNAAAAVPDARWDAARETFDGVGPAHYREHAAQIRDWRKH